jgi:ribosome-interacting GTPase 1
MIFLFAGRQRRVRRVIAVTGSFELIPKVVDAAQPASLKRIVEGELESFRIRLKKNATASYVPSK